MRVWVFYEKGDLFLLQAKALANAQSPVKVETTTQPDTTDKATEIISPSSNNGRPDQEIATDAVDGQTDQTKASRSKKRKSDMIGVDGDSLSFLSCTSQPSYITQTPQN